MTTVNWLVDTDGNIASFDYLGNDILTNYMNGSYIGISLPYITFTNCNSVSKVILWTTSTENQDIYSQITQNGIVFNAATGTNTLAFTTNNDNPIVISYNANATNNNPNVYARLDQNGFGIAGGPLYLYNEPIKLANMTDSLIMQSSDTINANGTEVTSTQLGCLNGVTSNIQTQINSISSTKPLCWIQMYNPTGVLNHSSGTNGQTFTTVNYSSGNNYDFLTTYGTAIVNYSSTYDTLLNYYMSGGGYNSSTTPGSTYFSVVNSTTVGQPLQIECLYVSSSYYVRLKVHVDLYLSSSAAHILGIYNGTNCIYAVNKNSTAGSDEIYEIETIAQITTNTTFSVYFAQTTGTSGNLMIVGCTLSAEILA